ncbi:MAG: radical SAM protein, partial [Spirochaetaceae bacterium]|nr:radical SAM protein [Spirochaetaceae bacterium]
MAKPPLFGLTLEELKTVSAELGLPSFASRQIAEWLYKHRASSFEEMTNLSKTARSRLSEHYEVGVFEPSSTAVSTDGTKKYLFSLTGHSVETAWIPDAKRGTLCVSTQIGCRRGCKFCMTARQGFQGNLSAGEILNQYRSLPEVEDVTHFVFMGMGEPLDNLKAVLPALEILSADWGFGFSPKKITVSTIGILDNLDQLLQASECRLALSLHSPFPEERAQLVPYERSYPILEVLGFLRRADLGKRRLTIEYLMIDGVNDSARHSRELSRIIEGLEARVNLIPY